MAETDTAPTAPIADKPATDQAVKDVFAPFPDPPRESSAADRLRAFEDDLAKTSQIAVVRIGGRIERGSGSAFAALDDEKKRQYAALEKLVEAEQRLADAHAALLQAEADHEAAIAAAEPKAETNAGLK